jgi:hypothetical protein
MNMDRPVCVSITQQQAARPILIVRVILYNLRAASRLPDFGDTDVAPERLIDRVP